MVNKAFVAHSNWFHMPVLGQRNTIRRTPRTENLTAIPAVVPPLHDREIGAAAHALGRFDVRNPDRRPVAPPVAATRDLRMRVAYARDATQVRRQFLRARRVRALEAAHPAHVVDCVVRRLVLVQVEVNVRVEERFLRQDVGVHGELVVLDDVALGGVVFDRAVVDWRVGRRVRGVHEEDGFEDVPEVAGEVCLELVGDARDADEKAMDEIFA